MNTNTTIKTVFAEAVELIVMLLLSVLSVSLMSALVRETIKNFQFFSISSILLDALSVVTFLISFFHFFSQTRNTEVSFILVVEELKGRLKPKMVLKKYVGIMSFLILMFAVIIFTVGTIFSDAYILVFITAALFELYLKLRTLNIHSFYQKICHMFSEDI